MKVLICAAAFLCCSTVHAKDWVEANLVVQPSPPSYPATIQPVFRTPVRTGLWRAFQPKAYLATPVACPGCNCQQCGR